MSSLDIETLFKAALEASAALNNTTSNLEEAELKSQTQPSLETLNNKRNLLVRMNDDLNNYLKANENLLKALI